MFKLGNPQLWTDLQRVSREKTILMNMAGSDLDSPTFTPHTDCMNVNTFTTTSWHVRVGGPDVGL